MSDVIQYNNIDDYYVLYTTVLLVYALQQVLLKLYNNNGKSLHSTAII